MSTTTYVCPTHDDVILFTDEEYRKINKPSTNDQTKDSIARMIIVKERPRECHKCQKSYYKRECKKNGSI